MVCVAVWTELLETRTARPFSFSFNTSDYRILHMDQDQGRLYLGCREYLVALDMHNVNKEPLIVSLRSFENRPHSCLVYNERCGSESLLFSVLLRLGTKRSERVPKRWSYTRRPLFGRQNRHFRAMGGDKHKQTHYPQGISGESLVYC